MSVISEQPLPHPEPPADLQKRELPIIEVEQPWFRIHKTIHSPLFFGRSGKNRFDAPSLEYSTMYIAGDPHGAFIETFGSQTGIGIVSYAELSTRSSGSI